MFDFQGLPSNIHSEGPLIDDMDWSFADGRPGVPRSELKKIIWIYISLYEIKSFSHSHPTQPLDMSLYIGVDEPILIKLIK